MKTPIVLDAQTLIGCEVTFNNSKRRWKIAEVKPIIEKIGNVIVGDLDFKNLVVVSRKRGIRELIQRDIRIDRKSWGREMPKGSRIYAIPLPSEEIMYLYLSPLESEGTLSLAA